MPAAAELLLDPPFVDRQDHASSKSLLQPSSASNGTSLNNVRQSSASVSYVTLPDRNLHDRFIKEAVDIILRDAVYEGTKRENKVVEWQSPAELLSKFDFDLKKDSLSHDKLLAITRDIIHYSVKTGHPYFVNQLFSTVDPFGLVGQWLTDALNPSVYTYEVAPVFTLMEETVLSEMRRIVGFPQEQGDGIFCPGGSIANGYAISCARFQAVPEVKTKGLHGLKRMVLYTSEEAHYSIKKLAVLQGIGADNVYLIKTDNRGKMDISHLEAQIKRTIDEGALPFMVSATAGTTVLGAFDPLEKIANICKQYNLWFHVDAAWGGGALMSRRHKHLLSGIERADSVTWNPHKMLAAPQQCSTFLTRHKDILTQCHSANAQYLFQKDKFYDTRYDTGDKHIQCGRRADVLKFWFMWKAKGTDGFEAHVDNLFDNARYFTEKIRHHPNFELVLPHPECTNICFWFVPKSLQGTQNEPDYTQKLHKVAPKIKEEMVRKGSMLITYQPLNNLPNFFRLVLQNSALNYSDMDYLIEELERLGSNL
ncbi:glutamate decarboxylase-like protein black [Lycorma delicatula]|uniref:glutamate decarboxylase-like protein black n=1 Tax=Lycorma delicatula TaxID=130591 RepID=UPI003F51450D